jgi:hypothetical protein
MLFVLSQDFLIVETTTSGTLLASLDISAAGAQARLLAYAPPRAAPRRPEFTSSIEASTTTSIPRPSTARCSS